MKITSDADGGRSRSVPSWKECKIADNGKNATMSDYRKATGFEALMGYLYLKDEFERLVELVKTGVDELALKM